MNYSNDWLLAELASGVTYDYVYFWGHRPPKDGSVNKSCLSQWYAAGFTHDDHHYPTAEHWMMYHKAMINGDEAAAAEVLATTSPGTAKAIGRRIRNYDNEAWAKVKYGIVVEGNVRKFEATPSLREFLLGTGNAVLVEASPFDAQWGIGLREAEARSLNNPGEWRGTNLLGYALMEARDEIAKRSR